MLSVCSDDKKLKGPALRRDRLRKGTNAFICVDISSTETPLKTPDLSVSKSYRGQERGEGER